MEVNQRIETWLSSRCESPHTRHQYLYAWESFTEFCTGRGLNPAALVDDYRTAKRQGESEKEAFLEKWNDAIRAFLPWLKNKAYASLSVKNYLVAVKSFLSFWDIPLKLDLPKHSFVTYHNRDIRREELKRILTFAGARDRVIWLLMAESGMRSDNAVSLRYGQIKEDFEAARVPMRILLPSSSLKDHVGDRFTFIGYEGFKELANYLQGKKLSPDDYVFASERQGRCKNEQFSAGSLSVKFNRIVQKLGIDKSRGKISDVGHPRLKEIRLHGLRKYFRNNHGADSSYIEFWMGHSLGVDQHYISHDVEQHRKKYAEGYDSLRVFESGTTNQSEEIIQKQAEQIKQLQEELKAAQENWKNDMSKILETPQFKAMMERYRAKIQQDILAIVDEHEKKKE